MIRQCQALPRDFQRLNQEQRQKAEIDPRNAFFEAFGIRPDTELQRVHAEQVGFGYFVLRHNING